MPKETGSCFASIPQWYYDQESQMCKEFVYGGCGGNDNRFNSEQDCIDSCGQNAKPEGIYTR